MSLHAVSSTFLLSALLPCTCMEMLSWHGVAGLMETKKLSRSPLSSSWCRTARRGAPPVLGNSGCATALIQK